ncbi:Protein of unknown function [Cotesia congregata]|uniref:Uncharacterized protein n=1 Tax=Cotesia congregata TaxID=51543 RepID=A0A8J2EM28_COTCN|nr:Protein of unknown function [Cotesia congregata]
MSTKVKYPVVEQVSKILHRNIFSYYLKELAQFDKEKHDAQMKQFYNYISSKITDTRAEKKRPNKKKLPKVNPVESSDTEDISDIEEDTIASNGEEDSPVEKV